MTSREFTAWKAYDAHCPIDGATGRMMLAQLMAMYLNAHKAKGRSAAKAKDFIIDPWKPRRTPQDLERTAMAWAKKYNANLGAS